MKHRPSSLPMLAQCPRFEGQGGEFAEAGTDRHHALSTHFSGDDSLLNLLDEDQAEGVKWAAEYIRLHAPLSDHPIFFEKKISRITNDFEERSGTPDAVCSYDLFDLKWRQRDYAAQMADYALMLLDASPFEFIRVHLLFAESKRAEVFKIDREAAEKIVGDILERANNPNAEPVPCDYCSWCANKVICKAFIDRANAVAKGRDWEPVNYHSSEVTDENEMAKLLRLARQLVKWAKAVEFQALEMAQKQGKQLPGYAFTEKKGRQYCTDVAAVFNATGMPQEMFLKACDLRLNTSKKYPEKKGAVDLFAEFSEMKKAPAKRVLLAKIDAYLQSGKSSLRLTETGETQESEDSEE